jgi:hypothetical protein
MFKQNSHRTCKKLKKAFYNDLVNVQFEKAGKGIA